MATGTLSPEPYLTVVNASGVPYVGAKIFTYIAGTTTPAATYTDVGLTVANANPIIADSAGRYTAFLPPGTSFKYVIQDSTGAAIKTIDNISSVPGSSLSLDITGTAGEALTAGQAVYLSDGSGGKTAGQWFKADAANTYSSTTPEVGMVPANISSGSSGTIRLSGSMTGLSSLTIGSSYFVGTAGAITSTPPTNARLLGVADTTSSLVLTGNPPKTGPGSPGSLTAHGVVIGAGTSAVTVTAVGTTGQLLTGVTGADPTFQAASSVGASTVLLKANNGTDSNNGATNVDTIAITGLTAKDRLVVEVSVISVTQQTAGLLLRNSTDGVTLVNLASGGAIAAGEVLVTRNITNQSQASTTSIWSFTKGRTSIAGAAENLTVAAVTQAWTGTWTLALQHTGVTAGGTLQWSWSVYKMLGQ